VKVLIIGATGFAGRALLRRLRHSQHEVSGVARSPAAMRQLQESGVKVVRGDVSDPHTLVPPLVDFDAVVFMVRIDLAEEFKAVQVLLDALQGTDKRFIFTSGAAVLNQKTDGDWHEASYAEDDSFSPFPFVAVRCATEEAVRKAAQRGVHSMVVRPPMIWGHGFQRMLTALHATARSGAICYLGRGLNVMSSIHVDDLAEIYALALERGKAGALYHAVSGEQNWRALAAEVSRLRGLPLRSVTFAEARELLGDVATEVAFSCCSRIRGPRTRDELGWLPHPDRLDIFADLAHPAFMQHAAAPSNDLESQFKSRDSWSDRR
jgi:nucleoside-diphosphate-sugar epimerase